jgi:hypothetical protein
LWLSAVVGFCDCRQFSDFVFVGWFRQLATFVIVGWFRQLVVLVIVGWFHINPLGGSRTILLGPRPCQSPVSPVSLHPV